MVCVSLSTSSRYYMTVSPVDGSLYVSDAAQLRVMRVSGASVELVAGNGQPCVDDDRLCGKGQFAVHSPLSHPKGLPSVTTYFYVAQYHAVYSVTQKRAKSGEV